MKRRSDIILAKALKLKKYESEANMRENLAREAKENECPNLSFTYAVPEEKTRNQQQREWIDDDCSVIEDSPQREMPFLKLNQENNQVLKNHLMDCSLESTFCANGGFVQSYTKSQIRVSETSSSSSSSSHSESSEPDASNKPAQTNQFRVNEGAGTSTETGRNKYAAKPSYRISPLNSCESDVDLSDDDPTFQGEEGVTPATRARSSSSSDSTQTTETTVHAQKPKKKQRNPAQWRSNVIKSLRNSGKPYSYKLTSKDKKEPPREKIFPARTMKDPCRAEKCRLKCATKINEEARAAIFQSYWDFGNLELQRAYISSCMIEVQPRYKYTNATNPRQPNVALYFTINGKKERVCKTYFLNTLGISDRQLRTVKAKINETGFLATDQRGKHANRKTIDESIIQDVKNHINAIPRIESHYLRASTSREFIDGCKTVKELWRDFCNTRNERHPKVEYWLYHNVFTTQFNIAFHQPKKDRCDLCVEFELASIDRKSMLKERYQKHFEEKTLCREEKKNDRMNLAEDNGNICVVYDLQAVMQCPTGDSSAFYYVSKLNCFNFTVAELAKKKTETTKLTGKKDRRSLSDEVGAYGEVFSYFWDETRGHRGANEIGSCILDYLTKLSAKYPEKRLNIIFYSDNCCGQNKNKFITSLYGYAVATLSNINSITHKYLIKGHTQNEGDNIHSLIEKEIKRAHKSGAIYTPHQYVALIRSAKKSGSPFKVQELNFDFFYDLKSFSQQWGYNFTEDDDRNKVSWNDIKVLKFLKSDPFAFFYKISYSQNDFIRIDMRNKRKKMPELENISVKKVFSERIQLAESKKKGLRELLRKGSIPDYYSDFYRALLDD
ncbi:uncharacterized protein LOC126971565 isoform X1 [Leptidea sinapis]|uniref:uncharacterized protein LOC126971565 isoform X1 n=1 Tax=Leptidea sinapis TaxID=189913 RepID=UPI0021C32EC3|nr:uncharacterized protein LOC126971565 isoform X1 [Leptidea sinapis]